MGLAECKKFRHQAWRSSESGPVVPPLPAARDRGQGHRRRKGLGSGPASSRAIRAVPAVSSWRSPCDASTAPRSARPVGRRRRRTPRRRLARPGVMSTLRRQKNSRAATRTGGGVNACRTSCVTIRRRPSPALRIRDASTSCHCPELAPLETGFLHVATQDPIAEYSVCVELAWVFFLCQSSPVISVACDIGGESRRCGTPFRARSLLAPRCLW